MQLSRDLRRLFAYGFSKGCGKSRKAAMNAGFYNRVLERCQALRALSPNSDEAVALRAGHQRFGGLLARHSETEALELARGLEPLATQASPLFHPLAKKFGHQIIARARFCLPQQALLLAEEWVSASCERQKAILEDLFDSLNVLKYQAAESGESEDLLGEYQRRRFHRICGRFLPHSFGRLEDGASPNCLGMAELLAAWCEVAGVGPYLIAVPLQIAQQMSGVFLEMLRRSYLPIAGCLGADGPGMLLDFALEEFFEEKTNELQSYEQFHAAVVIRLGDGSWYLLDPYMENHGVLPECWEIEEARQVLRKYQTVLPGLSYQVSDDNSWDQFFDQLLESMSESILGQVSILQQLAICLWRAREDTSQVVKAYAQTDALSYRIRADEIPEEEVRERGLEGIAEGYLTVTSSGDKIDLGAGDEALLWCDTVLDALSFGPRYVFQQFEDALSQAMLDGQVFPGSFELSLPENGLGLRVLCDLASHFPGGLRVHPALCREFYSQSTLLSLAILGDDVALDTVENLWPLHPRISREMSDFGEEILQELGQDAACTQRAV